MIDKIEIIDQPQPDNRAVTLHCAVNLLIQGSGVSPSQAATFEKFIEWYFHKTQRELCAQLDELQQMYNELAAELDGYRAANGIQSQAIIRAENERRQLYAIFAQPYFTDPE